MLNYTEPSIEDYAYMSDSGGHHSTYALNKTSNPPDQQTASTRNSSTVTAMSSSRSVPLGRAAPGRLNGTAPSNGSTRSFTSLTSTKPDPVGKPENCPAISPAASACHVYCCATNDSPAVSSSTTATSTTSTTPRPAGDDDTDATPTERAGTALDVSSGQQQQQTSTTIATEMLTNNVAENVHLKEGKNRNFRGPSDGGSAFETRASFGQVKLQLRLCQSVMQFIHRALFVGAALFSESAR